MKISIIGAGKWGLALRHCLMQKHDVLVTSRTSKDLKNFVDLNTALESDYLVIAIAAQATRGWLKEHFVNHGQKILVASKGIDLATGRFLDDIYKDYASEENLSFISGPSFAAEVVQSLPTALVVASKNTASARSWADLFPDFTKIYTTKDVRGVEIAAAYKNVIAIAAGLCDGFALGHNARAALITRGLAEMTRFGSFFKAKKKTFLGLSGAGDLFLTASSELSRNYRVGLLLASGKKLDQILASLGEVAEGVPTTQAIYNIAAREKIYCPIVAELYKILHGGQDPRLSIKNLLARRQEKESL